MHSRLVVALRMTVAALIASVLLVNYAAVAGRPSESRGRPHATPAVGPPLSPPVGPPLSPPVGPPTAKVDVCHGTKSGHWKLLSVSGRGKAVDAHLAHGDALPGQEVPGMTGFTFDDKCKPVEVPPLTFTPDQWTISLDAAGPGIHGIFMVAEVSPLTVEELQDLGGRLVWDETVIELCAADPSDRDFTFISVREVGDGFLRIGDGFQSDWMGEGCDINAAMQAAFDSYGIPETACLFVRSRGVVSEYCAPLESV